MFDDQATNKWCLNDNTRRTNGINFLWINVISNLSEILQRYFLTKNTVLTKPLYNVILWCPIDDKLALLPWQWRYVIE